MQVIKDEGSRPIKAWVGLTNHPAKKIDGDPLAQRAYSTPDIEDSALIQLKNLARLPFIHTNGVAVMPDVHAGIGSTVGTVIATDRAIIPAAVGVDVGCGVNAVRLTLKGHQLPDSLAALRDAIEKAVPLGKGGNQSADILDANISRLPLMRSDRMQDQLADIVGGMVPLFNKAAGQLGTLGSGNHFIELCLDEEDNVWVMLHSGSRGIGNMIGTHFISKAKKNMEKFFISLPDADLAYLPEDTDDFNDYVEAVKWAQDYALENRRVMMQAVIGAVISEVGCWGGGRAISEEAVSCHHNYVEKENHFGRNLWVTRKGAVSAREGQLGIIPGSMGQKSYIVRGKGNLESYCSCSHGAGRVMSRTEAKRRFSLADLIAQTDGVECRKDAEVIDEIPGAYKDLDLVMENQKDLVEVVHTLRAVLCVKGN